MKTLFIGLVFGAIAVWFWYNTGGKIYITETKTITNEVVVTVTKTQIVEQLAYSSVTRTNEVWKTNIVEIIQQPQIVMKKPVVKVKPKKSQPAPKKVAQKKWSLSKPRRSSSVKPGAAAPPPAGGGVMFNDGNGRSYRIVNGRRVYY